MRISLIGYMGCGKTSVGKRLARKLNYKFIDLDQKIEERYQASINDIFRKYDEETFRKLEQEILYIVLKQNNVVISMGGGTPCFFDNMNRINKHSTSVYLQLNSATLNSRLKNSKRKRPLLQNLSDEDMKEFIRNQLAEREIYYLQSKHVINGLNIEIEEIVSLLNE